MRALRDVNRTIAGDGVVHPRVTGGHIPKQVRGPCSAPRRALIAILVILAATGCSRGPGTDALKSGVSDRIAQALPPATVTLASFARRGSQSDTKAPAGETRRIIYFDTELKLERDFDFGAWDAPGVAGLVSALGAGPKGITGITSGGNKAGDVLRAHGAALYKREGDRWAAVTSGSFRPTVAPAYATNVPQGAAAILDAMRKVMESVQKGASPEQLAVIEEELATAHATIRARLARVAEGYAIAAGPEHGQYLRFVQALSDGTRARAVPLVTRGGEENLRLLRGGKVALALAQGDAALDAYEGKGSFSADGPYPTLRAVGSLYPEPVHVLVRADSALSSMTDLKDRRVSIGVQGSASRTTALRVMQAHGLGMKDFTPVELALGEALVALQHKEVDAIIQVIGMPADAIRDALDEIPLRLLPLSERAVVALVRSKRGYFAYSIPRGAYANQKQDARTIATAALLLAGADLSETEVAGVTRLVFEKGRDLAARGSAQGAQVSAATARHGLSIPMHVAAAKAFDAIK
jgi:TRAP transporter TAXI family solute receptor